MNRALVNQSEKMFSEKGVAKLQFISLWAGFELDGNTMSKRRLSVCLNC